MIFFINAKCPIALSFSAIADAQNAIERLYAVFEAETITETKIQDPTMDLAVKVVGGDFTWDAPPPEMNKGQSKYSDKKSDLKGRNSKDVKEGEDKKEAVFGLKNVNMEIPKGQLIAIVGRS